MINAKALSQLLTENVHPVLYPEWFVITPNGTLISYSIPADTTQLRNQAALVAGTFKEQETLLRAANPSASSPPPTEPLTHALTIMLQDCNIIVRPIQQRLLLVLVASLPEGIHPQERPVFRCEVEQRGDARFPPEGDFEGTAVLDKQRKKVDAGVKAIREELEKVGFVMPPENEVA